MSSPPWSRVAPILQSALQCDEHERPAFVAAACGDDADLRREVDSLLAGASAVDGFLNTVAADLIEAEPEEHRLVGQRIGPYTIDFRLGAGGMGEVYRAHDHTLDRDVAVKILPRAFMAEPERVARFEREARILAALNHPRIGAIYGLEYLSGMPALILELVEGHTLAERLGDGPISVSESVAIAIAIAEALEAAHERGIIHRDIKPANVKLTSTNVKVLDFGLAKDLKRPDDDRTASGPAVTSRFDLSIVGSVLGTVEYMSPEQARGDAIDTRTDLFSLGAVLYEMVTGRKPFVVDVESRSIGAVMRDAPRSPRLANPAVSRELERIILLLLDPRRESRYQAVSDVRADLTKVATELEAVRARKSRPTLSRQRAVVGLAAVAVAGLAVWTGMRLPHRVPVGGEYTQVTHFADSVTSPALSADGRLLTFIRGNSTFEGPGQIYLKAMPDGEPVQLTSDASSKMSPVFSPDGSRIAYTSLSSQFVWDTWIVPVSAPTPRFWLANASGLTWIGDRRVLFSATTGGPHMSVVSADDRREAARLVYDPEGAEGMAHRSSLSPDGEWVLIAEMVRPVWQPCRLVAMDGGTNRRVGPEGQCTSAGWSPDGKWMYFSSNASGRFHIWRQRFPDGAPERITGGTDEEEGVAMSPDGRSLLTSIGNRQSSVWVRDASSEREVSGEGYAFIPEIPNSGMSQPFTAGGHLLYLVRRGPVRFAGPGERGGELWQVDVHSGQSEPLFPSVLVSGYDVSRDGNRIVFSSLDDHGTSHIWLASTDRRSAPRLLLTREADSPHFGVNGGIYFRSNEGGAGSIYRLGVDGNTQIVVARPVVFFLSVSPDGAWLVVRVEAAPDANSSQENLAFPTAGGTPIRLCDGSSCEVDWTPNGKSLVMRLGGHFSSSSLGRTVLLALQPGEMLPALPSEGIRSEADLAGLHVIHAWDGAVYPSDDVPLAAVVKSMTERNIYRIPLP